MAIYENPSDRTKYWSSDGVGHFIAGQNKMKQQGNLEKHFGLS